MLVCFQCAKRITATDSIHHYTLNERRQLICGKCATRIAKMYREQDVPEQAIPITTPKVKTIP